jgi:hypothetical protein
MKRTLLVFALLVAGVFSYTTSAGAQEQHPHRHDSSEKLGVVDFKISCNSAAQSQFNRAVAWLHSFEYEEAEKAFTEVTNIDPRCAMGYWGIALSNYQPLWAPPTATQLKKGQGAIERRKKHVRNPHASRLTSPRWPSSTKITRSSITGPERSRTAMP